jgi:hypothetical protein
MQWQPMTDVAATTSPQWAEAIRARLMGKQPARTTTGIITREVVKYVEVAPPADQNEHVPRLLQESCNRHGISRENCEIHCFFSH